MASGITRRPRLTSLSIADLHAEIRRREKSVAKLHRKRARIESQLADIERQIRSSGAEVRGAPMASGRKRPQNDLSLVEALAQVLAKKEMSVTDAAEAVQKAGYQTTSRTFRTMVNIALIKSGKFKRTGRGVYVAK